MNIPRGEDVLADLKQLEQEFRAGVDCDIESVCLSLDKKYEETTRWIQSIKPSMDASLFQKDEVGQALIPEDVLHSSELIAVKSTANGDCLFNSASLLLCGTEILSKLLRLLTVLELFNNKGFYAHHPLLNASKPRKDSFFSEVTNFTLLLTSMGMKNWEDSKDRLSAIEGEACIACKVGAWSEMFHLMALSTVTGRNIFSVYPNAAFAVRDILHSEVKPRTMLHEKRSPLSILWSRYGNLDSRPGSWFEPNHFVPLFPEKSGVGPIQCTEVKHSVKTTSKKCVNITNFFSRVKSNEVQSKKQSLDISEEGQCSHSKKRKTTGSVFTQGNDDRAYKEPRFSEIKCNLETNIQYGMEADNNDKPMSSQRSSKKTRKVKCATVEKWKKEDLAIHEANLWLEYDSHVQDGKMYCTKLRCKACTEFQNSIQTRRNFSTTWLYGSTNCKLSNVNDHATSEIHKIAFSLLKRKRGESVPVPRREKCQTPLEFKLTPDQQEDMKRKFDVSYFCAKEELPLSKYEKLIALEKRHGIPHGSAYSNRHAAVEFISYVASELKSQLSQELNRSKFYSLLFDSTTDSGTVEQLGVFALYFDPDPEPPLEISSTTDSKVKIKMQFLSLQNLNSASAEGIVDGMKQAVASAGLKITDDSPTLVGLGGDGCTTNRGSKTGVKAILKSEKPWLLFVWCFAHRLELAIKDALTGTFFDNVDDC